MTIIIVLNMWLKKLPKINLTGISHVSLPHSLEIVLLEGNLCNFDGKFIIKMDIFVFFLRKFQKICKKFKFWTNFFWPYSREICIYPALHMNIEMKYSLDPIHEFHRVGVVEFHQFL